MSTYFLRALEVLAKPALVPAPPMQPPGQAMPSIMQFLILPALARVRTFLHSARLSACSMCTGTSG